MLSAIKSIAETITELFMRTVFLMMRTELSSNTNMQLKNNYVVGVLR